MNKDFNLKWGAREIPCVGQEWEEHKRRLESRTIVFRDDRVQVHSRRKEKMNHKISSGESTKDEIKKSKNVIYSNGNRYGIDDDAFSSVKSECSGTPTLNLGAPVRLSGTTYQLSNAAIWKH